MTKVMIVDDELPIREWLQYTLGKTGLPLEVCALCSNGTEAMDAFVKNHPTLIFTDIKMPGKDGITLLQEIRQLDPNVYIVMLTSHDSFEYARKSLKYNANEYILKNEISTDALLRIFRAYQAHREREKTEQNNSASNIVSLQILLEDWQKDEAGPSALYARLPQHVSDQDFRNYFVIAVPLSEAIQRQCRNGEFEQLARSMNAQIRMFYYNRDHLIILISLRAEASIARQYAARRSISKRIRDYLQCPLGVCINDSGVQNFPQAVNQAVTMLAQQFYDPEGTDVFFQEDAAESKEEAFRQLTNTILQSISARRITEATTMIRQLLDDTHQMCGVNPVVVKSTFLKISTAFQLTALSRELRSTAAACAEAQKNIEGCHMVQTLQTTVLDLLDRIEVDLGDREYSRHVQQAISMIHEEYASIRRISDVSDRVNLNQEYFCRVFKQETGTTFNNYLTNYRINIAKHLLSTTDQKIADIAQAVGYPNLSYFSRVFKNTTGVAPFHFRDGETGGAEQSGSEF